MTHDQWFCGCIVALAMLGPLDGCEDRPRSVPEIDSGSSEDAGIETADTGVVFEEDSGAPDSAPPPADATADATTGAEVTVHFEGTGSVDVEVTALDGSDQIFCRRFDCSLSAPSGGFSVRVTLTGRGTTFEGFRGPCASTDDLLLCEVAGTSDVTVVSSMGALPDATGQRFGSTADDERLYTAAVDASGRRALLGYFRGASLGDTGLHTGVVLFGQDPDGGVSFARELSGFSSYDIAGLAIHPTSGEILARGDLLGRRALRRRHPCRRIGTVPRALFAIRRPGELEGVGRRGVVVGFWRSARTARSRCSAA